MAPTPYCLLLLTFVTWVAADCYSYGRDFVNGEGPYCIDTRSSEPFSFGSYFLECKTNDTMGDITPILVDPNFDDYACSDIGTQPDNKTFTSYCNVTDNILLKNQMFSGDWIVVIEGLTFAWMRTFNIIAAPPKIVTQTSTAVFTVSETPTSTLSTVITRVDLTTATPATTTLPSAVQTKTVRTTPARVTVTSTQTITRTRTARIMTKTWATTTLTTSCATQKPVRDPACTIRPPKASLKASEVTPLAQPIKRYEHLRKWASKDAGLAKRSPDACTSTTLASNVASITVTYTAPASTELITKDAYITSTITPTPVTVYSGKAKTTTTITAATPTRTVNTRVFTTTATTKTVIATITSTIKVPPSGVVCKPSAWNH